MCEGALCNYCSMARLPLDFQAVRRIAITAPFSDDFLFEKVVLRGGNAISLALGLGDRTSLDLDFSIENDFEDIEDVRRRISEALLRRFGSAGYVVFDFKFEPKPKELREGASPGKARHKHQNHTASRLPRQVAL